MHPPHFACGPIGRYPVSRSPRNAVELSLPGLLAWPVKPFAHIVFDVKTGASGSASALAGAPPAMPFCERQPGAVSVLRQALSNSRRSSSSRPR